MTEKQLQQASKSSVKKHSTKEPSAEKSSVDDLSKEETRQVLTPFAFKIDPSLFGLSLAAPWRRLVALLIDLLLIAILSGAPGELLAIVIAITFYRLGSEKHAKIQNKTSSKIKGRKRRSILRFISAFIIFIVLLNLLPFAVNEAEQVLSDGTNNSQIAEVDTTEIGFTKTIEITALAISVAQTIEKSPCADIACYYPALSPNIDSLRGLELPAEVAQSGLEEMVDNTNLSTSDKAVLLKKLMVDYQSTSDSKTTGDLNSSVNALNLKNNSAEGLKDTQIESQGETPPVNTVNDQKKPVYSIIQFIKGIITDLGLGFGWAAFYFTVFTALWRGQTPGKKLLNIKVLQLDGTPLSMWDSFGRYGGYGAGIATGLIGFIQIFWDANRQAIHDKISATVVISGNEKNRVNKTMSINEIKNNADA